MIFLVGGKLRITEGSDGSSAGFQGAVRIQIHMFGQADIELAVLVLHPDVVVRQAVQGGSPDDIQLLVELLADDFRGIVLPVVPGEFQAVFQGGHCMEILPIGTVLAVLVDDPGDVRTVHAGLAVGAILSELAFFRTDDSGGDAVLPILAVDADGTGLADFAIRTGYAILTCMPDGHAVSRDILVHEHVNGSIAVCILFYRSYQVLAGILVQIFLASACDANSTIQLVAHRIIRLASCRDISPEFQAIIQGSYRMGRSARFSIFPILIDNASNAIGAIDAWRTIGTIGTILADGLDDGGHRTVSTILAGDADLAVSAIFAVDHHRVSRQGFIQLDGDVAIIVHFGGHVVCTVVMAGDGINALDFDGSAQFHIMDLAIGCLFRIGIEVQAFDSIQSGNGHRRFIAGRILYLQGHFTLFIDFVDSLTAIGRIGNQVFFLVQEIGQIHVKCDRVPFCILFVARNGKCLSVCRNSTAGSIVIMETINRKRLILIFQSQFQAALSIIDTAGITGVMFPVVLDSAPGDEYIAGYGAIFDFIGYDFQLIFCSRPAALDLFAVPIGILEARNVVIHIGIGTGFTICFQAALLADDNTAGISAFAVRISAYTDAGKTHIILRGHGDVVAAARNGNVLALHKVDFRTRRRHSFLLCAIDIQFPAGIDRIGYSLELVFRSRPAADDTIAIRVPSLV